ncbi:MAG: hypothetical protein Q8J69_08595 [Sphingobacteriaceae bacterium]|nr:hypothetical protein [Sphingobacteriaceae bacterium]
MIDMRVKISEKAHAKLLQIQLERKLKKEKRTSLAEIAADVLDEYLVTEKAPPK